MTTPVYQIPRNSLTWMLCAHVAAVLPHLPRLPMWLTGAVIVCVVWRIMVFRGQWPLPKKLLRGALVVLSFVAVLWEYGSFWGIGPGVALLVLTYSLKLLEMHRKRDAYVVVVLGYFVVATEFFFEQGIPITIYQFIVVTMITAALIGLHQTTSHRDPVRTAKMAGAMVLQSIPLMIILFVFFPRIAPLWSLDLSQDRATTGLSDSMSPGDIQELSREGGLAFRVYFNRSEIPENDRLYWRAMVLSYFDGRKWTQATKPVSPSEVVQWQGRAKQRWDKLIVREGEPLSYTVIMEPTDQRWLFALDTPTSTTPTVGLARDYRLIRDTPTSQLFQYDVTSHMQHTLGFFLEPWVRKQNLQLPNFGNDEARELAQRLMFESDYDHQRFVESTLNWFRERPFVYTLKPSILGRDSVDEFLFKTQEGFCAHYSSAFAFMMRAAGVPARIVSGYQGGERNPVGNYLLVHQFDAHAWTEVWLDNRGWVRIDPTGTVAPERIEMGIEDALRERQELGSQSAFSSLRYRDLELLNKLRFALDYVNFSWNKFVLGYDVKFQMAFLQDLIGTVTPERLAIIMMTLIGLVLFIISLALLRGGKPKSNDRVNRIYLTLLEGLEKLGVQKSPEETPIQFANRLMQEPPEEITDPWLRELQAQSEIYMSLQYRRRDAEWEKALEDFRKQILRLNRQISTAKWRGLLSSRTQSRVA